MQTFLPSADYEYTSQILDNKRLNKQILEGYQILKILSGASESGAWKNHPAVLMWKSSEQSLMEYISYMVYEAKQRGIKTDKNVSNLKELKKMFGSRWNNLTPLWTKPEHVNRVTTTHKANLYKKDSIYYLPFKSSVDSPDNVPCCDGCKYYWVTHLNRIKV